ncbi:hypothetical protein M3A74_10550 [Corynebacterium appendicis]|uniref:hypothetical protein n=1 Tax=Corynebacterium appendicis TaxID=163202 RepID=UPI00223BF8AA|nr:hypothetical protein [Corynebacterium appendicis]MCT1685231.1 hypothetical protein [Corynebacterium appendicis]
MTSTPPFPGAERVRNQKATRVLVAAYFTGLTVAVLLFIASLATGMGSIVFVVCYTASMLVSMVSWTIIRGANDRKDRVPEAELDEYERNVFTTWRNRAFRIISALNFLGGFSFCAYAYFAGDTVDVTVLIAAGLYMIFTYLFVSTLPMIGYAITFNRKED